MLERYYFTLFISMTSFMLLGQNPHGNNLNMDCAKCHESTDWKFNEKSSTFNHDSTSFPLSGQHQDLECRSCHNTLQFDLADNQCISCHTDIHQLTVGPDCVRCHNTTSWVIENITLMHEKTTFPLMGAHASVNCNDCHISETNLRFFPIHPECISCHRNDYLIAKTPDHISQGFSQDCSQCHRQTASDWSSGEIVHSFFPLEQGHHISDCTQCHKSPVYSEVNTTCVQCHLTEYNNAFNPDHRLFPDQCNLCHDLTPGWRPAKLADHDSKFPIYSGKHKNEWDQCIDCHTTPGDFIAFSCVQCHEHNNAGKLANEHDEVSGYQFVSSACYSCHPKGN